MKMTFKRMLSFMLCICLILANAPAGSAQIPVPKGRELSYTGEEQTLVKHEDGYEYYFNDTWLADGVLPKATEVGVYSIKYRVIDSDETLGTVKTYIYPVAAMPALAEGLVFNGSSQTIATAAADGLVSLDGSNWQSSLTRNAPGDYTVYYKSIVNGLESEVESVTVSIARKAIELTGVAIMLYFTGSNQVSEARMRVSGSLHAGMAARAELTLGSIFPGENVPFTVTSAWIPNYENGYDCYTISNPDFSGTVKVSPLELWIYPDAGQSMDYMGQLPELTYTAKPYSGSFLTVEQCAALLETYPLDGKLGVEERDGKLYITLGDLRAETNPYYDIYLMDDNVELAIDPIDIRLCGAVAADKVYDGSTAVSVDASDVYFEGLPEGHSAVLSGFDAAFADADAGEGVKVNLTNPVVTVSNADGEDVSKYFNIDIEPIYADIKPVPVSVSIEASPAKTYDGNTEISFDSDFTYTYTGLPEGYTLNLKKLSGHFDNKNAGSGKTVSIGSAVYKVFDGNHNELKAANYGLNFNNVSGQIKQRYVTVAASDFDKTYDGGTEAVNFKLEIANKAEGDDVYLDFDASYMNADGSVASNAGAYILKVSDIALAGTDAGNYLFEKQEITYSGSITPAALTVIPDAKTKEYLDEDPVFTYSLEGVVEGDTLSGMLSRESGQDVGDYRIVQGTLDNSNYDISIAEKYLTIEPRTITVSGLSAEDKVYDGSTDVVIKTGAISFGNVPEGFDFSEYTDMTVTAAFADADAGEDKAVEVELSFSYGEGELAAPVSFFSFVTASELTADISPMAVKLTVDETEKVYGEDDPDFDYSADFDSGETLLISREEGEDVGEYDFTVASGAEGNFDYSFENSFSIGRRDLSQVSGSVKTSDKEFTCQAVDGVDSVDLKLNGTALVKDKDYSVSGNVHTKLGKYTVTVTGIGNFTGSISKQFSIVPPAIISKVLNGSIKPATVTVSDMDELKLLDAALATIDEDTQHPKLDTWKKAAAKMPAIMEAVEELEMALALPDTSKADALKKETLKISDKETLEEAQKALEEHLDKYGSKLDKAAKDELEAKLDNYEELLGIIAEAEKLAAEIEKWLDKYMPYADADELELRAQYRGYTTKINKLDKDAKQVLLNSISAKLYLMEEKLYTYYIIKGHDQYWLTSSDKGASFTSNGHISLFKGIYVDEKLVDSKYYTVKAGSTVVEFSKEFMDTLKLGKHQIQFKYEDGYSTVGLFTVTDKIIPATGDEAQPGLWAGMMLIAAAGVYLSLRKREEMLG